ncbi:hypothetical protein C8F01DRAFT_1256952 [Mycena amicta]|nr:hypothetical protein C8F01DRAFT_1256952 [Mycena amicta]
MSSTTKDAHDEDCSCTDSRLTNSSLDELLKQKNELDPQQLSPDELDAKVTYCLQYLLASDVPPREKGRCTHVMGHIHANFALSMLAKISYILRPAVDSSFVTRLVEAWPGIWKWLEYTFQNWIVRPMFFVSENETGRYNAIIMVVSSLRSFFKLPPICDLLLAEDGGKPAYIILGSCWLFENEEDYKKASEDDRLLSAAEPLLDLATFKPGPPPEMFFGCILSSGSQDTRQPARVALDHLAWYLETPVPWSPPALFLLDYHLRMACTMTIARQYLHALLAEHSVRTVTRILVALTSTPYDELTATGTAQAITSALTFLEATLPDTDGFAWTTHSVQIGLLPAILRAQEWIADLPEDREASSAMVGLLRLLSLYTLYPSLLRPLVRSVRRSRELNLPDNLKDNETARAVYQELEELVNERSTLSETDIEMRCHNSSCRKIDTHNNFSSCSGCFTVAYCSSDCQKAHWKSAHRSECSNIKELRANGREPPMSTEDHEFATGLVVMEEVRRRKAEITPVWRAEPPERTPVLSINLFHKEHPRGILVVGAPDKHPPQSYVEHADVRARWDDVISQEIHKEHIIVGAYLPYGCYGKMHFLWMGIDNRVPPSEGSVVERLIRTVEIM